MSKIKQRYPLRACETKKCPFFVRRISYKQSHCIGKQKIRVLCVCVRVCKLPVAGQPRSDDILFFLFAAMQSRSGRLSLGLAPRTKREQVSFFFFSSFKKFPRRPPIDSHRPLLPEAPRIHPIAEMTISLPPSLFYVYSYPSLPRCCTRQPGYP